MIPHCLSLGAYLGRRRNTARHMCMRAAILAALLSVSAHSQALDSVSIQSEADRLAAQGDLVAAASTYLQAAALQDGSAASQSILRAGDCLRKAGSVDEALKAYDKLTTGNSVYWRQVGLLRKAKTCIPEHRQEALRYLAEFKAQYPDSTQAIEAVCLLLSLNGVDSNTLLTLREREKVVASAVASAEKDLKAGAYDSAIQTLRAAVSQRSEAPSQLRAHCLLGHALLERGRREEAASHFEFIIQDVGSSAADSVIVRRARLRLAALYHRAGRLEEAKQLYSQLKASGAPGASRAALQFAGVSFEILQHAELLTRKQSEGWSQVQELLLDVINSGDASAAEKCRAELMLVETYSWERKHAQCLEAARKFLDDHREGEASKQDLATVHFFAADAAFFQKNHAEALKHLRWIIERYGERGSIWSGMDHIPRCYYRLWEVLRILGAPEEEVCQAAQRVLELFPDSSYAQAVQSEMQNEALVAEYLRQSEGKGDSKRRSVQCWFRQLSCWVQFVLAWLVALGTAGAIHALL